MLHFIYQGQNSQVYIHMNIIPMGSFTLCFTSEERNPKRGEPVVSSPAGELLLLCSCVITLLWFVPPHLFCPKQAALEKMGQL